MTQLKDLPNFSEELQSLLDLEGSYPPVDTWHPEREGEVEITIRRDGSWWFQNEEMTREATVQLFSRILRKDSDKYVLVTPAEKMSLTVELFPFVVRMMDVRGEGASQEIIFSTNVGDTFVLSKDHCLSMLDIGEAEPAPVVEVRSGLMALVSRQVYYELADYATESPDDSERFGVWSQGEFFNL